MNQSHKTTLMSLLKEAIRERHARMDSLPYIVALTNGQLPLESYVRQLRAMAVIHATLEHELSQTNSDEIRAIMLNLPSRLVHLRKDLSGFDHLLIPDIEAVIEHTRRIAEQIRHYRVKQPINLLGVLYVLQGTTLGNSVHLKDIIKAFGAQTSGTAHYYAGYGHKTSKYWKEFCSAMNSFPIGKDDHMRLIRVALDFFDQLEALYSALFPAQNAKMVFTASMLNPEAGDHAVPGDAWEINAAVAAADKCRREFPYFDERYQERGKSFAKSDAAWLATLSGLPDAQLLSQVEWLGRVLGNRGMPRITLERQLELLYDELAISLPSKTGQYKGLLEVAESLKAERLKYIPEPVFNSLVMEFHIATDDELQGRFKRTGDLIVSAVCDQTAGITGAVTSLLPWLMDAKRFPPQWITAVSKALDQALERVKRQE